MKEEEGCGFFLHDFRELLKLMVHAAGHDSPLYEAVKVTPGLK